jgi:hypothetical protein
MIDADNWSTTSHDEFAANWCPAREAEDTSEGGDD